MATWRKDSGGWRAGWLRLTRPMRIALARCSAAEGGPAPDQSAYEPLFRSASEALANYRGLLGVKAIVPDELAKISGTSKPKAATKAKPTKPAPKPAGDKQ